ncbi:hypothetical protein, partial [Methylobacterium sp. NFXW15]|uniref:hypothetical protein n=1 Tax=Methylobacterium sp. NFXW15 TaxID=2819512 RepID=UPI003CEBF7AF
MVYFAITVFAGSIMEDEAIKYLYCTADGAKAEVFAMADGPETVRCPTCGQTDTFEEAVTDAVGGQIDGMLDSVFSESKNITVTKSGPDARW